MRTLGQISYRSHGLFYARPEIRRDLDGHVFWLRRMTGCYRGLGARTSLSITRAVAMMTTSFTLIMRNVGVVIIIIIIVREQGGSNLSLTLLNACTDTGSTSDRSVGASTRTSTHVAIIDIVNLNVIVGG